MTFIKSKKNAYRKLQTLGKKRRKQRQRENKKINKALAHNLRLLLNAWSSFKTFRIGRIEVHAENMIGGCGK